MFKKACKVFFTLSVIIILGLPVVAQEAERSQLTIETATGETHEFEVELADTNAERAQGLMFRRSLEEGTGMFFLYPRSQRISMWMKNTLIPLDIIFIDEGGQIVRIAQRTIPESTTSIPSGGPAKAVLEVNAGVTQRLGIDEGDQVHHPALQ
ncbi:DUF192 domain-containing protein [Fodinicurvata halophila]|uniref:DUF192 domain-containing protein n=1 Tax=Fodinicurvata halophila TaxID=1419723 RepID=A0ABV8UKV5_9PROT